MTAVEYEKYLNMIEKELLDEATDFRREIMPRYIYKFFPIYSETGRGKQDQRRLKTLSENKIWCSKIDGFNDPYEGIGYYFSWLNRDTETRLASILRIASFSENAESNIAMWAYYANNHKGFCVKYEVIDNKCLYDVNYIENRVSQKNVWKDAMKKTALGVSTEKEQLLIYEKYLTKHVSWSSEREYRTIVATERKDKYGREITCERLGLKPIKIYAGINCPDEVRRKLRKISEKLSCGQLEECYISNNKFILFNEVTD